MAKSLRVQLPDGWSGEAIDLSATGLRIRTLAIVPVHTDLSFNLLDGKGLSIPLRGRVAWAEAPKFEDRAPGEFGVELSQVPPPYLSLLTTLFADAD